MLGMENKKLNRAKFEFSHGEIRTRNLIVGHPYTVHTHYLCTPYLCRDALSLQKFKKKIQNFQTFFVHFFYVFQHF